MPFDFAAVSSPFRMQPGLRRLAVGEPQLTPNGLDDRALREKLAVLSAHAEQAFVAAPGFDAAPALHALCMHASDEHPNAFSVEPNAGWCAIQLGWSVRGDAVRGDGPEAIGECLRALPGPWRLPGLLALAFAEDFAIVDAASGRIPWLAVCLPSSWAPEAKVGKHFTEVHAPVADNALLISAADHLMRLVTGPERWERFVWTISRHATLAQHPLRCSSAPWPTDADADGDGDADADVDADALAAKAFFRTERQTFIPMPGAGQAVFTIHVENEPLTAAINSPAHARQLHAALASMSPAVLAYRGLTDVRDRLLVWLSARSAP